MKSAQTDQLLIGVPRESWTSPVRISKEKKVVKMQYSQKHDMTVLFRGKDSINYLVKVGSDLTIQLIDVLTNAYSEYLEWIRLFGTNIWKSSSL
jgi:Mg2+ and Co2+ transporter CorA